MKDIWEPAPGDAVICYTTRDYGVHGVVLGVWGRIATVKLVNGHTTQCNFCDLSPR